MTADGRDMLSFLDCVLTEQERALTPLVGLGTCPDWGHCHPECTHQFGINDSEAKLRRCAAERKILELHRPDGGDCIACADQETYSEDSEGQGEWARYAVIFPCPTVRALAEGYGWADADTEVTFPVVANATYQLDACLKPFGAFPTRKPAEPGESDPSKEIE